MNFSILLRSVGLTQAELARELKRTPNAVSNWRAKPPFYVIAFLKERLANIRLKDKVASLEAKLDALRD